MIKWKKYDSISYLCWLKNTLPGATHWIQVQEFYIATNKKDKKKSTISDHYSATDHITWFPAIYEINFSASRHEYCASLLWGHKINKEIESKINTWPYFGNTYNKFETMYKWWRFRTKVNTTSFGQCISYFFMYNVLLTPNRTEVSVIDILIGNNFVGWKWRCSKSREQLNYEKH